jgi:hypothetical protein
MTAERTHQLDMDVCLCAWIVEKIRTNKSYAQNFYAALCNREWYERDMWQVLQNRTWSCSWRTSGGIVADIRGNGEDCMDWYCSGMMKSHPDDDRGSTDSIKNYVAEGMITAEIRSDLAQIGWYPVVDQ